MEIDYLIIGQGLAGSLLAWELIQRQKKVIVIDNNQQNASLVAAGLINPVTGMRFVKNSNIDQLLPTAIQYYQQLAQYFQKDFYIEKPMLRLLRNDKEVTACNKRFKDLAYNDYLSEILPEYSDIVASHGIVKQHRTGYLLTTPLLAALKSFFIEQNCFIEKQINYHDIKLSPALSWKQIKPKQIIFCEGHHAKYNPWFSALPFQLVKGEIISATASKKIQPNILNYGHWFIPIDNYQFRTGASFDRENIDTLISSEAKETLLNSLQRVYPSLSIDKLDKQQAGIRPTTLDKMPFVGSHPKHPELVIFNGFGAKGSLQIPWHSQNLADHLLHKQAISASSDIFRYHSLLNLSA